MLVLLCNSKDVKCKYRNAQTVFKLNIQEEEMIMIESVKHTTVVKLEADI